MTLLRSTTGSYGGGGGGGGGGYSMHVIHALAHVAK